MIRQITLRNHFRNSWITVSIQSLICQHDHLVKNLRIDIRFLQIQIKFKLFIVISVLTQIISIFIQYIMLYLHQIHSSLVHYSGKKLVLEKNFEKLKIYTFEITFTTSSNKSYIFFLKQGSSIQKYKYQSYHSKIESLQNSFV